jgi:hypothetical protein
MTQGAFASNMMTAFELQGSMVVGVLTSKHTYGIHEFYRDADT